MYVSSRFLGSLYSASRIAFVINQPGDEVQLELDPKNLSWHQHAAGVHHSQRLTCRPPERRGLVLFARKIFKLVALVQGVDHGCDGSDGPNQRDKEIEQKFCPNGILWVTSIILEHLSWVLLKVGTSRQ
jgi:hypothetical protein